MAWTPAGSIGMALVIGLAAATAGGFVYLQPGPEEDSPETAGVPGRVPSEGPPASREVAGPREPPRFDLVRVAPDGSGLAAGRADPGARIRIRSGDETLAEVEAGSSGEFAALFRANPGDVPDLLSLEAVGGSGESLASEQQVLLLPPSRSGGSEGQRPSSADARGWAEAGGGSARGGDGAGQPADPTGGEAVGAAAILAPGEPAEVAAAVEPGSAMGAVSLASIEYGEDGSVRIAGSAPAGSRLRIYVDGAHAGDRIADAGGGWDASLDGIDAGIYRIRVDALGEDGEVASRVETPFQRTFPDAAESGTVTVQPGHNLWTIARTRYGSGMLYTQIFTANAELIENPDLIYPGQIFVLPEVESAGGAPNGHP